MAGNAIDEHTNALGPRYADVLDRDVAQHARRLRLIAGAERLQACAEPHADRHGDAVHRDVGKDHVVQERAVDRVEGDAAQQRVANLTIADADVLEVSDRFRAELDGVAPGLEFAASDGDVAAGQGAGGFQADGVVAGVDIAVPDTHAIAGIGVDAVVVRQTQAANRQPLGGDIFALEEMHRPCAGVDEADILDRDIGAAHPADEKGADRVFLLRGLHRRALAVDGAGAFDGDLPGVHGDDERVTHLLADAVDERIGVAIVGGIGAAEDDGAGIEMERDAILELDRAGEIAARGECDRAAPVRTAGVDGFLQRGSIEGGAVADGAGIDDGANAAGRGDRHGGAADN